MSIRRTAAHALLCERGSGQGINRLLLFAVVALPLLALFALFGSEMARFVS